MKVKIYIWECDSCDDCSLSLKESREHSIYNHGGWSKSKRRIRWATKHQPKRKSK